MKKMLTKLFKFVTKERDYIRDIYILLLITRLIFLENNQIMLLFEMIGGVLAFNIKPQEVEDN